MPEPITDSETAPTLAVDLIVNDIANQGWSIQTHVFDSSLIQGLADEVRTVWQEGSLRHGGIGRGENYTQREDIRSDQIQWIEPTHASSAIQHYLDWIEDLRQGLNRELQLGLFDVETQLAAFEPGTYYRCHVDQLHGSRNRVVSCILYLNADWEEQDAGQLRLYLSLENKGQYRDIFPQAGTMVCFLSEDFPHEVRPTQRLRYSITSWLRLRGPTPINPI